MGVQHVREILHMGVQRMREISGHIGEEDGWHKEHGRRSAASGIANQYY